MITIQAVVAGLILFLLVMVYVVLSKQIDEYAEALNKTVNLFNRHLVHHELDYFLHAEAERATPVAEVGIKKEVVEDKNIITTEEKPKRKYTKKKA